VAVRPQKDGIGGGGDGGGHPGGGEHWLQLEPAGGVWLNQSLGSMMVRGRRGFSLSILTTVGKARPRPKGRTVNVTGEDWWRTTA